MANPTVVLETTLGNITLELDETKAPVSVQNFLDYAKSGHYNGTIFHRVIANFMAQGGGFDAAQRQKPTKAPIQNEAGNGLKNARGTVAMARTSDVNSATSQFFVNLKDNDFLDHTGNAPDAFGYCVFGRVSAGMDVVDAMAQIPVGRNNLSEAYPAKLIAIRKVTIS